MDKIRTSVNNFKKAWNSLSNLTRFMYRNMLWGGVFAGIGVIADVPYLYVAGAIYVTVPVLLVEFAQSSVNDWNKAYDEARKAAQKDNPQA